MQYKESHFVHFQMDFSEFSEIAYCKTSSYVIPSNYYVNVKWFQTEDKREDLI